MIFNDVYLDMNSSTGTSTVPGTLGTFMKYFALIVLTTCTDGLLCDTSAAPTTYCETFRVKVADCSDGQLTPPLESSWNVNQTVVYNASDPNWKPQYSMPPWTHEYEGCEISYSLTYYSRPWYMAGSELSQHSANESSYIF